MKLLMPLKELIAILLGMNIYMIKEYTLGININLQDEKLSELKKVRNEPFTV